MNPSEFQHYCQTHHLAYKNLQLRNTPKKTTRKKGSEKITAQPVVPNQALGTPEAPASKPKRSRKQSVNVAAGASTEPQPSTQLHASEAAGNNTEPTTEPEVQLVSKQKPARRVGQRQPQRD